jgi:hypothetical protein
VRNPSERFHHLRVRMRMFVSVEMGRLNPGAAYSFNLRPQFPLNLLQGYPSGAQPRQEDSQRLGESSLLIYERRNFLARRNRCPANQYEMTSHSKFRIRPRPLDRPIERQAIRHQRRTRQNSISMSANDSLVYAVCQAKVVRIENQLFHFERGTFGQDRMIARANFEQDLKGDSLRNRATAEGWTRQGNFHAREVQIGSPIVNVS